MEYVTEIRDRRGAHGQLRRDRSVLAQVCAHARQRTARRRDRDELGGLERRRFPHAIDRARDIHDAAQRQPQIARCEQACFGDLGGPRTRVIDRVEDHAGVCPHETLAAPRGATLRPVVDERRPSQVIEGPLPDHGRMLSM